ncbi:RNA polymerase sigma factor [Nonomuraea sp. SYSU D8015]|uniref:RNA polymerase sigma factor n=1 Tax=Nonomuraea sp. SYSU D8015 TaxID=2593644 RepID=UPI0016615175|nr:sigma-70 family RNA polymerase sigma factor [Nonomuraea sp. SYSU D8015]
MTTHLSLAHRFSRGNDAALAEIYRTYSRPLFSLALSLLGDRELAAEAVQVAFIRAWRAAVTFDPGRELQPWLYAIARRAATDVWRRERRHLDTTPLDDAHPAPEPSSDHSSRVRQALKELPREEREVLLLSYFEGLTHRQIADRLRIPPGTVHSRAARARRLLAAALTEHGRAAD